MIDVEVARVDHLGIIAGTIKDLGLIEMIDERIKTDPRESVTAGEAVAAMIINGLGFSDRPLTLTPQFFETKALDLLIRPEVRSEHLNRFKLGRALDDCFNYGCDTLFAEISARACESEGVDMKFNSLDTTAFSLTGEYDQDCDEYAIEITHGYSKDHRPDLKQAVLELMCSHDGAIPIISRSWNGNASDTKIFRERANQLVKSFKESPTPRYLIADSKLYSEETALQYLREIGFITRIPGNFKLEQEVIQKACELNQWSALDNKNRFQTMAVDHYQMKQRWIVVYSEEAKSRAEKSVGRSVEREAVRLKETLSKLSSESFSCAHDAEEALKRCARKVQFHEILLAEVKEEKVYAKRGRPSKEASFELRYRVRGEVIEKVSARTAAVEQSSCYVIGTNISSSELSEAEVIQAYKRQNSSVEMGFRFLKDPLMFTSSLYVKKPERIMGLLMVMTLSLLVYGIAQRRLRNYLKLHAQTVPDQKGQSTSKPTLRWVFQLLDGIEIVKVKISGSIQKVISGLNDLKIRILSCFGDQVAKIYGQAIETAPS